MGARKCPDLPRVSSRAAPRRLAEIPERARHLPHAIAVRAPIGLGIVVLQRRAGADERTALVQEAVAHIVSVPPREGLEFLLVERRKEHRRKKIDALEWRIDPPRVAGLCREPTKKGLVPGGALFGGFFVDLRRIAARGFRVGPAVTRCKKKSG
jgi:hypothetical protein